MTSRQIPLFSKPRMESSPTRHVASPRIAHPEADRWSHVQRRLPVVNVASVVFLSRLRSVPLFCHTSVMSSLTVTNLTTLLL